MSVDAEKWCSICDDVGRILNAPFVCWIPEHHGVSTEEELIMARLKWLEKIIKEEEHSNR